MSNLFNQSGLLRDKNSKDQSPSGDEKLAQSNLIKKSNKNLILKYQALVLISFAGHFLVYVIPKLKSPPVPVLEMINLTLGTLAVQIACISAMHHINRPFDEVIDLNSFEGDFDLAKNNFVAKLRCIIFLMSAFQVFAQFSESALWLAALFVPLWCFQLTLWNASAELKKDPQDLNGFWVKVKLTKPPKKKIQKKTKDTSMLTETPTKQQQDSGPVPPTPRTRTRAAVRNMITGVSDKYRALEQNVSQKITKKMFNPLSIGSNSIEEEGNHRREQLEIAA